MVDREVNPLEQRHLALAARFKAAWAFHQLLTGMQRLSAVAGFENRSETFQSLFSRLKSFSENLHGPTTGLDERSSTEIGLLEREVDRLYEELVEHEESIAPSALRGFFTQVRALDDRILIEVVRFYLEIQTEIEWPRDRMDKVDFLLSRLAEKIAGPNLQADRRRLDRVLQGLLSSAKPVLIPENELESLIGTLQDLRSEVRWVKTFVELNESRRVEVYRALKHDMGGRIFHQRILPLVVEVNNAFRRKIDDLRSREELRLIEDYQQLSQLQERSQPPGAELQAELVALQTQVDEFRHRAKSNNVRLSELATLGDSLRDVMSRLEEEMPGPTEESPAHRSFPSPAPVVNQGSAGLLPDLDSLQPHWNALLRALSGLDSGIADEQARSEASLAVFRLVSREIEAFRRTLSSDAGHAASEQFVLAAASLRRRICQDVEELRGLESRLPGSTPRGLLARARESARMADAFAKHFSHLIEQAVFDGQIDEAREFQGLCTRLQRESSGLVILLQDMAGFAPSAGGMQSTEDIGQEEPLVISNPGTDPFGDLDEV